MKNTVKLFNTGTRSVPTGRTKEGFPIVLHPGKSISVEKSLADDLQKKHKFLSTQTTPKQKAPVDKPKKDN